MGAAKGVESDVNYVRVGVLPPEKSAGGQRHCIVYTINHEVS